MNIGNYHLRQKIYKTVGDTRPLVFPFVRVSVGPILNQVHGGHSVMGTQRATFAFILFAVNFCPSPKKTWREQWVKNEQSNEQKMHIKQYVTSQKCSKRNIKRWLSRSQHQIGSQSMLSFQITSRRFEDSFRFSDLTTSITERKCSLGIWDWTFRGKMG